MKRKFPISEIQEKRRNFVNFEFKRLVEGTHMSNKNKAKLMKKLWNIAKKRIQ